MSARIARVTFTFDPKDAFALWTKEIIDQVGVVGTVAPDGWNKLSDTDVLVLIGDGALSNAQRAQVIEWCNVGEGALVCVGGTWGFDEHFGFEGQANPAVLSRADFVPCHPKFDDLGSFSFIGGKRVASSGRSVVMAQTPEGDDLIAVNERLLFFAPDPGKTFMHFALGRSVGSHKIAAGDGTTPVEDGFLRAEDGTNLEWSERKEFEGKKVFATPHVDLVREAFVRVLCLACNAAKVSLAINWQWPDNAPAVTVCSLDWDGAQSDQLRRVITYLTKFGVVATWMGQAIGQPQELYKGLRQWNHDFGLLFKPESGQLKAEQVRIQYLNLSRISNSRNMAACRGADGYWHGLTSLYESIETAGGTVSLSKGGQHSGTTGFTFGTARPYYPINRLNKRVPVLEIPFQIVDPGVVTPVTFAAQAIAQICQLGGCVHVAVNVAKAGSTALEEGLEQVFAQCRTNRFQSFLGERLADFDSSRRSSKVSLRGSSISVISEKSVEGITIMVQGNHMPSCHGKRVTPMTTTRYGTNFTCATLDVEARSQASLLFTPSSRAA